MRRDRDKQLTLLNCPLRKQGQRSFLHGMDIAESVFWTHLCTNTLADRSQTTERIMKQFREETRRDWTRVVTEKVKRRLKILELSKGQTEISVTDSND